MTPDDLRLLHLLRRDWDANAAMPAVGPDDWEDVVRRALHRGVAGLLCRALLRGGADVPDEMCGAPARRLSDRTVAHRGDMFCRPTNLMSVG